MYLTLFIYSIIIFVCICMVFASVMIVWELVNHVWQVKDTKRRFDLPAAYGGVGKEGGVCMQAAGMEQEAAGNELLCSGCHDPIRGIAEGKQGEKMTVFYDKDIAIYRLDRTLIDRVAEIAREKGTTPSVIVNLALSVTCAHEVPNGYTVGEFRNWVNDVTAD